MFWFIKVVKGSEVKDEKELESLNVRVQSRHPWVNIIWQLTITWLLCGKCINQSSDAGTFCSAASSLSPSSLPSPSSCQQVWSGWHGKTAVWLPLLSSLTDPLPCLFSFAPVTWDSNTLDLLPTTTKTTAAATRPLSNPPGELGRALACHWGDMTHTVMQHKEISLRGSRATSYSVFQNALLRCNPLSDFQVRRAECDRPQIELNFKIAGFFYPNPVSCHVEEIPFFSCSDTDLCSDCEGSRVSCKSILIKG